MDDVARDLLAWYDRCRRVLPWREQPGPYRTWVSEIMLQQTRVDTVLPYFERFMARFPTVEALAAAPLDDLLALWSGLGYYSRARNLHAAARHVAALGAFPDTLAGLRALPGVGDYTAAAIASIAYGQDVIAVDGNIERVISRLHRHHGPRASVGPLAQRHLPAGRAGDFNQALMDLGASCCAPRDPDCGACPIAAHCAGRQAGDQRDYPAPPARKTSPTRLGVAGALWRDGRVLLARRPDAGLLGGLFELPGADLLEGESPRDGLVRAFQERLSLTARPGAPLGAVQHVFTHLRLTLTVLPVEAEGDPVPSGYTALTWARPDDPGDLGLSTLARKALALAAERPRQQSLLRGG